MKKIGLLGGMAWPSTIDYYRAICEGATARNRARGAGVPVPVPWITIESVNMAETRALRGREADEASWAGFDAAIAGVLRRLESAGCEILAMASNTPHARLHAVKDAVSVPVVSILEETAKAAAATGATHALVLGTAVTMRGAHYPRVLREHGVEPNQPLPDEEVDGFQHVIDTDFHEGATPGGKAALLALCRKHVADPVSTAVLLACTELPLAYPNHIDDAVFEADGYLFVNTAAVHVKAILAACMGDGANA